MFSTYSEVTDVLWLLKHAVVIAMYSLMGSKKIFSQPVLNSVILKWLFAIKRI